MEKPEKPADVVKATSSKAKKKTGLGARSAHKDSDWYASAKKAVAIMVDQQKSTPEIPLSTIPLRRGKHG